MMAEDTKAALRTFDEHFHLMTLIESCCIQESLQSSGLIPNGDLFTGTPSLAGSTLMDNVLKEVRSCIECNGAEKFLMFINVLQTEGRYVILGCHIFSKLHIMYTYKIYYVRTYVHMHTVPVPYMYLFMVFKVTGNALNIEYYFWWCDDFFGLLIHHDAPFHFMVSISDEYKYKRLVKTTFKSCGKPIFLEIYHTCNRPLARKRKYFDYFFNCGYVTTGCSGCP